MKRHGNQRFMTWCGGIFLSICCLWPVVSAWRDSLALPIRKMAETRNDFFHLTRFFAALCDEVGIRFMHEVYDPEQFGEVSEWYSANASVDRFAASVEIYSRSLPALLKFGKDTPSVFRGSNDELDVRIARVFDPEILARMNATDQIVSEGRGAFDFDLVCLDYWGMRYRFFAGPWPEEFGPVLFRCYSRKRGYVGPNYFGPTENSSTADRLTVSVDGEERGIPADGLSKFEPIGWFSQESYIRDVYIWSYGANGVCDQPIFDPSYLYADPTREHYRHGTPDAYLGGGDDVNNWDELLSFGAFYPGEK